MYDVKLRINEVLEEKGKSIKWLSDELGITYANTNNIVNNKAKPSLERLNEIANKLGCQITEMFEKSIIKGDSDLKCPKCGAELELKEKQ